MTNVREQTDLTTADMAAAGTRQGMDQAQQDMAKGQSVKVTLKVTYTPKGGNARSLSKGGIKLS